MKKYIRSVLFDIKYFWRPFGVDCKWYKNERIKLAGINICDATNEGHFSFIHIQVAKFIFEIYRSEEK